MPYRLRKAPKRDLYWVVDDEGKKYSKDPLPKERAEAQIRALYAAEKRGGNGDGPVVAAASAPPPPPPPPPPYRPEHYKKKAEKKRPSKKEIDAMMALGRSMGLSDDEIRVRMGLAPPPIAIPPRDDLFFDDDDEEELRRRGFEILNVTPSSDGSMEFDERGIPMPPRMPPRNRGRVDEMEEYDGQPLPLPPAFDRRGQGLTGCGIVVARNGRFFVERNNGTIYGNRNGYATRGHAEQTLRELANREPAERPIGPAPAPRGEALGRQLDRQLRDAGQRQRAAEAQRQRDQAALREVAPELPMSSDAVGVVNRFLQGRGLVMKIATRKDNNKKVYLIYDTDKKKVLSEHATNVSAIEELNRLNAEARRPAMRVVEEGPRDFTSAPPSTLVRPVAKRGKGAMPPRNDLQQIASASYNPPPPQVIGNLRLLQGTPTLVFYLGEPNTIVVGIRGTVPSDTGDLKADASIVVGQLRSSNRFKNDLRDLQEFQMKYPPAQYDYYGVGHSLGGAILDEFLKMGLLKRGVSYNPAVQPQTLFSKTNNERVYEKGDPLYQLIGRFTNPEVRDVQSKKPKSFISKIPRIGQAYDYLQSHGLKNFVGGSKPHGEFAKQLHEVGIDPSSYLRIAQERAKAAGLPHKLLGFADDDKHKLAIPDKDGKIVKFGAVGYGDHILWSDAEARDEVPKGYADEKRRVYRARATKIKGDWKKDPFSPNNLALKVLW